MPPRAPRLLHPQHHVTAILVSHDGGRWLPDVLVALHGQTRKAQRIVSVDTGSTDDSLELLSLALGEDRVVRLPRETGFGAAVAAGLARAAELAADEAPVAPRRRASDLSVPSAPAHWIWLLHDDAAPDPDALAQLLEVAVESPSAAVLGPKARDWDDPRLLVEVGVTVDRAGRRETGLERREYDQGQHDAQRDVLAVGSAGCLVRRDVWDELGGYDPALPFLRDDLDFGWRANMAGHRVLVAPNARLRHAGAIATGRRPLDGVPGRLHAVDRRHALLLVLANLSAPAMLWAFPRLAVGALFRTLGFLLTRQVAAARDELAALGWTMRHLPVLAAARSRRRGLRRVPAKALRPLFAGRAARLRGYLEAVVDWLTGGGAAESSPLDPEEEPAEPPTLSRRLLSGARARPGAALVLALLVLTLVAARDLVGGGVLVGGELLPPPDGVRDLWHEYAASWHPVGPGSGAPASPALALLGVLGTVLLGKAWLAVDLLLVGCVPLAGLTAYRAARHLELPLSLRLWGAATYALLPIGFAALADGRLDAAVAVIAMPPLVVSGHKLLTSDPRYAGWRTPFAAGLGLAVTMAFAPQVWPLVGVPLLGGAFVVLLSATPASRAGAVRRLLGAVIALAVPLVVLLPWSLHVLSEPALLFGGPAARSPVLPSSDGLELLLLRPGGPGQPADWVAAGLVLAAVAALLRGGRPQRRTIAAWALAGAAYGFALLVARGPGSLPPGFAGPALALAACALLVAAATGAVGARDRLRRISFGWRQPAAVIVAAIALAGPVAAAAGWVARGAGEPLDRRDTTVLPAVALAESTRNPGARVLWLAPPETAEGPVRYALTPVAGLRLGDLDVDVAGPAVTELDTIVRSLTAPLGGTAAEQLTTFAVRYVAVAKPVDAALAAALDAQPGLARVAYESDFQLWRTLAPAGRLRLLAPQLAGPARAAQPVSREQFYATPPVSLRSTGESARVTVPAGPAGRLLVLSESADDGWVATLDGVPLEGARAYSWAQAFSLPTTGGALELRRESGRRRGLLSLQALLLLVTAVLAAPSVRRSDDGVEDDGEPDEAVAEDSAAEPVLVSSNVRRIE